MNKICVLCKKEYKPSRQSQLFCSRKCYLKNRWKKSENCLKCGKRCELRFCSRKCQQSYWDTNGYKLNSKRRFWKRKEELIKKLGGKCVKCGISDIRVLDINHIDRKKKTKIKYYSWQKRLLQWEKDINGLELLCANCHRVHTWEQMGYGKV